MSKQKDRKEIMRYGNFIVDSIIDRTGHMTHIEVRASSGNFKFRVDEYTFMFGLLKELSMMDFNKEENKRWFSYIHATIALLYRFGTCGIPVETITDIGKALTKYDNSMSEQKSKEASKSEDKESIEEMKREQEMSDELKNIKENEKKI